mgnify:CR=1 FL=1
MKQRIRRIWLALCMAVCLFALAGCSAAVDTAETIDPQIEMAMQSGSQQYLDLFNQMDDASIEQALATSVKNKDTVMENALKSWDSIKDDLGAFVSSETAVVTKSDDGYVARMNTVYEKRAMEFTLIADEDLSKVETISFSPVYTTGEKMAKAGMNTLMGMGVVFAVLIFISWLISMFKYINVFEAKMKAKKAAAAPAPAAAPAAPAPAQQAAPAPAKTAAPAEGTSVDAPMPGNILEVKVANGAAVKSGDVLVILEAMKMENEIVAPQDGTVVAVSVAKGDTVEAGQSLVTLG